MKKIIISVLFAIMLAMPVAFAYANTQTESPATVAEATQSASLFENTFACDTIVGNQDFPEEYSQPGNGVKILGNLNQASVRYRNVIDASTLTKDENLIAFQILSMGHADVFDTMYITLTDIYDSSNTVRFRIKQQTWRTEYSMVAVNYDGRWMYIVNQPGHANAGNINDPVEDMYGSWVNTPFDAGKSDINGGKIQNVPPLTIKLDYDSGKVYLDNNGTLCMDMLNESMVGVGNQWKKFTTGECYLDITYENVMGSCGIIVSEIAGQSLSGETLVDTTAPVLKADLPENYMQSMPDAQKNGAYPLPQFRALDVVDGSCEVEFSLSQSGVDVTDSVLVEDGNIYFRRAGTYDLNFTSEDKSGNPARKTLRVVCEDSIPLIDIHFAQEPETAYIGSQFYLPEIVAEGGSGNLELTYDVYYNNKKITVPESRYLDLTEEGEIRILCEVKDYIGTLASSAEEFVIEVLPPQQTVLYVGGVPHSATKGKQLVLPDFEAINYNHQEGEAGYYPEKKVTVNGVDVTDTLTYTVTEEAKTVLEVVYSAGEGAARGEKKFNLIVIDPKNVEDYFIYGEGVTVNGDGAESRRYTQFDCSTDMTYLLSQPVMSDYLEFELIAGNSNFEYFDVVMEDYYSGATVFFRFKPITDNTTSSYMQLNGIGSDYTVNGSFYSTTNSFSFIYDNETKTLLTGAGDSVCTVARTADGQTFDGFESGAVRFSVRTNVRTEGESCKIRFYSVSNQNFISPFQDRFNPEAHYFTPMEYRSISIGDEFVVAGAVAYDVLDCNSEISVSLVAPDGTKLLDKAPCDQNYTFKAEQYGRYTITYYIFDSVNRDENMDCDRFNVIVRDEEPPVICVQKKPAANISLGEMIERPVFTVTDNYSETTECGVYVKDTNGYYIDISAADAEGYVPQARGEYIVYILAYDEAYNACVTQFNVTVS